MNHPHFHNIDLKFLLIIFSFFILIFTHAQAPVQYMEKKNGKLQTFYPDSKTLMSEGEVHKHLKTGLWKNYDKDGSLKSEETYLNGILNGTFTTYYAHSNFSIKGNYTNGIKTGQWETYNEMKKLTQIETYDNNGNKIGLQEKFSPKGILSDYIFIDSLKNKTEYKYDSNGKLIARQYYHNDTLEGLQYSYNYFSNYYGSQNDTLPTAVINYVHGKKEGPAKYYENGRLIRMENLHNGVLNGWYLKWDAKGLLQDSAMYSNGRKNGPDYVYEKGKLSSLTNFVMDSPDGAQYFYDE